MPSQPSPSVLDDFFGRSRRFHDLHPRPISSSTTLKALVKSSRISKYDAKKYIQTSRILVHPKTRSIIEKFLSHKRTEGTKIEKAVYSQINWNIDQFIVRLIRQRPLAFFGSEDVTLLRDGRRLGPAAHLWDLVGKEGQQTIQMRDYLTYDEMFIASLLGVSGYTAFLNDGNRDNRGVVNFDHAQREGVIVGLVGARFERKGRMDSVYKDDEPAQTSSQSFLRSFFPQSTFGERYKARMRIPIETLLIEAEQRGSDVQRKTWVHVVGLGLGVWKDLKYGKYQKKWYVEEFAQALRGLKIHWIHTLEFSYVGIDSQTAQRMQAVGAKYQIGVVFQSRPPSSRLSNPDLLLVTSYAWDGNSYPGNEFYMGSEWLSASGDPAAAASSLISETQNPKINKSMLRTIAYLP